MLTGKSYNFGQFDACVKTGQCKGSAKLVSLVSNFDSPSPGIAQAFSFTTFSPRRVSCSLSAGPGSDSSGSSSNTHWVLAVVVINDATASPRPRLSTQRTEASPCAVRTRDGTIVRRMDIGRRNLLGPALAGASVRDGEGQPNFPGQQRRKTSAPYAGVVVFFLSLPSRRLEQSPPFLGGAVLCSSFSFSLLIHVSTWTDL